MTETLRSRRHPCPTCGLVHKVKEPTNDVAAELHAIADGLARYDTLLRFWVKYKTGKLELARAALAEPPQDAP